MGSLRPKNWIMSNSQGTKAYLAPEYSSQINEPCTFASDIYSLGVTIAEVLSRSKVEFDFEEVKKRPTFNVYHEYLSSTFECELVDLCTQQDSKKRPTALQLLQFIIQNQKILDNSALLSVFQYVSIVRIL